MQQLTLGAFIQAEIKRRSLSIRQFADLVGVTHPIIAKFKYHGIKEKHGGRSIGEPSLDFLAKLAIATGTDLCTLVALIHPDATIADPRAGLMNARIAKLTPDKLKIFDAFLEGLMFDHFDGSSDGGVEPT